MEYLIKEFVDLLKRKETWQGLAMLLAGLEIKIDPDYAHKYTEYIFEFIGSTSLLSSIFYGNK